MRRWSGVVLVAVVLTACSNQQSATNRRPQEGSSTASAVDGMQRVTVVVDDRFRFDPSTITVHPGKVTVTLVHKGTGAPHDFQVTGFPGDAVPLVQPGQTTSATFMTPTPGRYQFVCTLHVAQCQIGTLVVLPD